MTAMLIHRYCPPFDVIVVEHTVVDTDVPLMWSALTDLDLMRSHSPAVGGRCSCAGCRQDRCAESSSERPEPAAASAMVRGDVN